jgi:cardiolipin synthase
VPDQPILSALKLAALRGVDVRILLPEKPDHRIVYLASFSYYQDTIPLDIKLYRYTAGFMHQKVFLVDSTWAAVGTANLDNRSFRLHFEITLLNNNIGFIGEVEDMLCNDFNHSRKVKLAEYTQKSFFFKLIIRSTRLLEPLL